MEKTTERKRKTKGSLSVLDEFTDNAGNIENQQIKILEQPTDYFSQRVRLISELVCCRLIQI